MLLTRVGRAGELHLTATLARLAIAVTTATATASATPATTRATAAGPIALSAHGRIALRDLIAAAC